MKPLPEQRVLNWFAGQLRSSLFTTTVTRGEIAYGVRIMPQGARRQSLWVATQLVFNDDFAGRVLNFDGDAAELYAQIAASRRSIGKPISQFDAMIAAITRSRGAILATRNVKDFSECGIEIVDPRNA